MADICIAVAGKVSDFLVAPIGRRLGYLFCYRSHTDELRNQVQKLGETKDDVQMTVDEATRRGDEIRPIVQDWLNLADQTRGEAEELIIKDENKSFLNGWWCPNLNMIIKSRYQLGREAYKKAQVIIGIREARNFPDGISYRVPPQSVTFREYDSFESRASTLNKIMDALRDDKTKMIGVWGMGGVGKTTLVKQVAEQAKQENLFTTQVYVQVSWTRDEGDKIQQGISDIQQHIAEMLGLEFGVETKLARAGKLMQRLKKEKILIILDDIWKEVNLEEVGIPSGSKDDDHRSTDCKIVLASRNEDLLRRDMGAQECFPIQHLQEEEAWQLFKKTTGDFVEKNPELRFRAKEVAKECQGLPIAIITIAMALKDEHVAAVWQNALDELRNSAPTSIRGVQEKVYSCLEWSYNHLEGDEVKSLFLLCGWLPYGNIPMDRLLRYAMGLNLFHKNNSLEQGRNKLFTLVRALKASSLLLDSEDDVGHTGKESTLLFRGADYNKFVKMHDVVRDVARSIASKDPHRFVIREDISSDQDQSEIHESKYLSLYCKDVLELPYRFVCPKLQFFLLMSNSPSLNITNTFSEGMNQLKVLDLSGISFTTLPSMLQSLANLRTLCLDWCNLGDIAVIGKLKKLQVLSMAGSNIQQLPNEMGQLTDLRLLDLNSCWQLTIIPRNILSKLSRLECLFMKSIRFQWGPEEVSLDAESCSNACLSELNHLPHLMALEVEISDVKLVPKEDKFFEDLTTYAISIGNFSWTQRLYIYKASKTLRLKDDDGSLLLRNGIGKLLKKTEELELRALDGVFCGPIFVNSFDNLKTLVVEECRGLKVLFLLSTARDLSQLEEMKINYCDAMQKILASQVKSEIQKADDVETHFQLFPKLRSLKLCSLPELMDFGYFNSEFETTWQGMSSQGNLDSHMPFFSYQVSFSNLEKLELINLPKLKVIWPHQLSLSLDSLSNLQILRVNQCPCLLNLIPCHLMQIFKNLKDIEVIDCVVLEHVFDLRGHDTTNVEILPKLETLTLINLVGLKGIIYEKNDGARSCFSASMPVSFHNLRCLSINHCGRNDNIPIEDGVLFGEKVSFPKLEELKLGNLSMLKMIWHPQFPYGIFDKLRILSVCNCRHLVNLIPSHLIQSFQNLKEVVVRDCKVLECAFDHQGLTNGDYRILPNIEILKLEELPKLRLIFCNKEKDNMPHLLSPSKLKDFYHLKEIHIVNCGMPLDEKVSFPPNLEVLVLERFDKMKEIDFGISPRLKILQLKKLPKLSNVICNEDENANKRCLLSPSTFKNFQNLQDIGVIDCGKEDRREMPFLESRDSTLNNIMNALRDDSINLIGVVGIGGVGKTTLVKQVALQAKEQNLFTYQVYLDLSITRHSSTLQHVISYIQSTIASKFLYEFEEWYSDESRRAAKMKQRLKKRKVLIILDDIWKEIDLGEVGIPSCDDDDEKECKVMLISRDRELLCKSMGAQVCFQVDVVPPEEAYTLFKKIVGDSMEENPQVRSMAIQVVEECEGLLIAIVTIAKALKDALKDETAVTLTVWENALKHLRKERNSATGAAATGGRKKLVYSSCLEWSYTNLKCDHEAKSLLLLCGMLGCGDIPLDLLLKFCIGLNCFEFDHMESSLEKARIKLLALMEILDPSRLLLDSHDQYRQELDDDSSFHYGHADNKFVRIHDVVYDVAKEISSEHLHSFVVKEDVVGLEEWSEKFVSLHCKVVHDQLPQGLVCPELQFFLLRTFNPSLNIPETFFQGMQNLRVLDLSGMGFTTLPSSLDSLANLRTLRLDRCNNLVDIALIGKLTKLLVLSLVRSGIQQLPNEMVRLSNLRLLDLNECIKLTVFPHNVLSSLSRLECLFMRYNFLEWAVDSQSSGNACLSELNHLSHLTTLYITIPDVKLLPKVEIRFENLTRYGILIGYLWGSCRTDRTLKLNKVNRSLHMGDNGIIKLLERSEEVEFEELNGTNYVLFYPSNRESFLELKHLEVRRSLEIEYIIDSILMDDQQTLLKYGVAFPKLESLKIMDLNNLEKVWHGSIPMGSFGNLKTLKVSSCPKLRHLFLLSMVRGLSQLENMTVENCETMRQIIAYERESENEDGYEYGRTNLELLPNLKTIKLRRLPELINFISDFETSSTCLSTNARPEDSLFNYEVSFSKLEKLELDDLPKLKDIWYPQFSLESFFNLRILKIHQCQCLRLPKESS